MHIKFSKENLKELNHLDVKGLGCEDNITKDTNIMFLDIFHRPVFI
jgi:hypothetical protein